MKKRLFAAIVSLCMIVSMLPTMAFAEAGVQDSGIVTSASGLCEHHTQHDESCSYTEGTAEIPCSHEHDESCGGLTDPEACNHSHDEACGYVPATEGTPCTFVCEVCNPQDSGNPATPSDAQPEECTCETLCTEEEVNADCPVCSAEGAELDKVCVGVAPMLPATALAAAEGAPNNLYVGNQNVKSGEATTFWTTDKSTGGLTEYEGNDDNWNVKYDPSTVTLTLKNAAIEGEYDDVNISGAGIYAASSSGPVSLNIVLEEENKVSGWNGINVSSGGDASLNISGSGSLTVSGLSGNGIGIFMSSQNSANLTIEEASVTALGSQNGGSGVRLITSQTGSPSLTIEVKGGSLQASGETNGIHFLSNVNGATAVANLKVSGNAMVKASNIITTKDGTGSAPELKPAASGSDGTGGIIWDGKNGTVYGDVTLDENLTIGEGESLTLDDGASLNAGNHNVIVDGGMLDENLANSLGNSVKYAPTITTQPTSQTVTEGGTATFTVVTSGTEPLSYQWQQSTDSGQSWTDITGETNATYTIAATTMDMSGTQYRCVVKNSIDEVTSDATLLTVKHNLVKIEYKAPTCTVNGNEEYWTCDTCGKYFSDANGDTEIAKDSWIISAINHDWNDAVYTWSDDGSTCTATRTCKNDSAHTETSKATVTGAQTKAPTCTEKGETTYTATFEADWAVTQTKVLADISATGHSYGKPVWSWSEDGKTCTVTFTCEKDETHKETPVVTVTSAVKTPATCTETGVTTYTATVEFNGQIHTDTKDVADIPATGHSYDNGKCTVCGAIASDFKVIITAGANGSWQKGTKDGLTFTSNAAYKHFQKVQVDGKDLDASNYTVKEGSTIVTLKAEYLETLSVGKHTLAIVSETGTATTEFTVKAAAVTDDTQSPQTGDDSNIALWIAVLLAAGTALTGTAVYSRKRKYSK